MDGSESSTRALDWAANEASIRKVALRLLHALPQAHANQPDNRDQAPGWEEARLLLERAEQRARRRVQDVEVTSGLVVDDAANALITHAHKADLLVVGTRGCGGLVGLVLGSVAYKVAAYAPITVAVASNLREPTTDPPEIVAGVDGMSADSVLGEAFREAALWRVPLRVVHAFWFFEVPDAVHSTELAALLRRHRQAEERRIEELLAAWRTRFPDVPVTTEVINDSTPKALVRASTGARMVVVGPRDQGDRRMPLGSVAYAILHQCGCPVLIARPHDDWAPGRRTAPSGGGRLS